VGLKGGGAAYEWPGPGGVMLGYVNGRGRQAGSTPHFHRAGGSSPGEQDQANKAQKFGTRDLCKERRRGMLKMAAGTSRFN
jgi:hypothetical protein